MWQCTHIGMCDTCVMCALDTVEHVHSHSKMHCNALSCRCTSVTGQSGKVRGGDIVRHGHLRLEISKIAFESCKCVMCIHIAYCVCVFAHCVVCDIYSASYSVHILLDRLRLGVINTIIITMIIIIEKYIQKYMENYIEKYIEKYMCVFL